MENRARVTFSALLTATGVSDLCAAWEPNYFFAHAGDLLVDTIGLPRPRKISRILYTLMVQTADLGIGQGAIEELHLVN
jgi:hypothetical protein